MVVEKIALIISPPECRGVPQVASRTHLICSLQISMKKVPKANKYPVDRGLYGARGKVDANLYTGTELTHPGESSEGRPGRIAGLPR